MVPRPSGHLQENPRLCQTVSQTSGSPARYSQTVGDDAQSEEDSQTVPDGLPDRRDTDRRLPDSMRRRKARLGAGRRLAHGARQYTRPSGHKQETLRQSATVPRPSGHLQESPRRCKKFSQTVRAPERDAQTVCKDA
ncbi:hypothetical protein DPMN_192371 [Dreissena polymorpha]|uniref:Uncharacterized protein n=1 Tax=Dreissena polymorpha TaxID=45954 RepID=A0A9D3Y2V9_DREPO|nr:hypothetical protein DPMN_192371 [Dreissena polymorpha]